MLLVARRDTAELLDPVEEAFDLVAFSIERPAEGIAESLYYSWSKEFLEAGKKRLAGDTARQATSEEVKALRAEARGLKEALAEQIMENRLLKKSMIADGGDEE